MNENQSHDAGLPDPKVPHDPSASDAPDVYDDLRALAKRYLSRERIDHTLQPTALVHEAFMRLTKHDNDGKADRARFFSAAARAMRAVLVDHARRRNAAKRGGTYRRVPLDHIVAKYEESALDLIALDAALTELAAIDSKLTRVIELRFFGGLSEEQAAEALGVSTRTVRRDWKVARVWLHDAMTRGEHHDE